MSTLKEYIAGFESDKTKLDEFASEFYNIKLDRRKSYTKMLDTFLKKAEKTDPIKQLPFEELLLEESNNEVPEVGGTDSQLDETEDLTDPSDGELDPLEDDESGSLDQDGQDDKESKGDATDIFGGAFIPFELTFKNGGNRYTMVPYSVSDYVTEQQSKGTFDVDNLPSGTRKLVLSLFWYIIHHGKVTVRESRNSRFITYTLEEFKKNANSTD